MCSSDLSTVPELVALAKSRPGKIIYWSSGNGGIPHLSMELFKSMTGADLLHVPYKGGGPAYPDFLAGRTQATFSSIGIAGPHVRAGRLRALGIASPQRSEFAPEIPTFAEGGLPGYEASIWYAVFAPRALPTRIAELWNREVNRMLVLPESKEQIGRAHV